LSPLPPLPRAADSPFIFLVWLETDAFDLAQDSSSSDRYRFLAIMFQLQWSQRLRGILPELAGKRWKWKNIEWNEKQQVLTRSRYIYFMHRQIMYNKVIEDDWTDFSMLI
jgi:hypothetical protein